MLCLLFSLSFSGRADAAVITEQMTAFDEVSFGSYQHEAVTGPYSVSFRVVETSLDHYFTPPYLSGGLMLAQNLRVGQLPSPPRTIFYDLQTGGEQELDVRGDDPAFNGSSIFYLNPLTGPDDLETKVIRYDINSGSEDVIYESNAVRITAPPVYAGGYLAWYEEVSAADDASFGNYRLVIMELGSGNIVYTRDGLAVQFRSAEPALLGGSKVAVCDIVDGQPRLRIVSFLSGDAECELYPGEVPRAVDSSNGLLALAFADRVDVYSGANGELLRRLRHQVDGVGTDVRLFDGRVVLYGTTGGVFAVDLLDGQVLYDSDRDYNELTDNGPRYKHTGWFGSDGANGQAVYRFDDRAEDGFSRLMLLTFRAE